jgi:hypothetical protein
LLAPLFDGGRERAARTEALSPIGCPSSAETVVATRKKSWRLDGHKLDRQRDWLDVSNIAVYFISSGAADR